MGTANFVPKTRDHLRNFTQKWSFSCNNIVQGSERKQQQHMWKLFVLSTITDYLH